MRHIYSLSEIRVDVFLKYLSTLFVMVFVHQSIKGLLTYLLTVHSRSGRSFYSIYMVCYFSNRLGGRYRVL